MALLTKSELIRGYQKRAYSFSVGESFQKTAAANELIRETKAFQHSKRYDIFLSHSYSDARIIKELRDILVGLGFSVYVDWIEDSDLNRGKVTKLTALVIRNRMNNCRCLLYATSDAAKKSVWMPWELGYMDAKTRQRVAIVPIVEESEKTKEFKGQEYLGIYPYVDRTGGRFYVRESLSKYVDLRSWIGGTDPQKH